MTPLPLKNVVIVLSSTAGATLVTDFIWRLLQWLLNEDPNAEIPDEEVARMARYLNRLNLQPPFPQMLEYLTDLKQNTTSEPTLQNGECVREPDSSSRSNVTVGLNLSAF